VVQPTYKVLNPQGTYIPVDCKPLADRIDTLAGKRILYYESEATNMQMPELRAQLTKAYPTTTFDVVHTESFGEAAPIDAYKVDQAVIRGVGW